MSPPRWWLRPGDEVAEAGLARELGLPPLLARLLVLRGLRDPGAAGAFLEPSLSRSLRSPMLFREMRVAAARVLEAVRRGERIVVYGDYDVDGVTGSAELVLFLRELGARPELFIPNRLVDGYGLRARVFDRLAAEGTRLVITVDCGAAAHEELAHARRLGLDVIVCDHHQAPHERPPATAVLNPVVADAGFPFGGLSAAGVVFYLLLGTRMLLREGGEAGPDLRRYLDLVALGTVADLVPLLEENRVLVKQGLREIARTERPGMRALVDVSGVELVSAGAVGFDLGPRINAGGRLADASSAVELLTSRDPEAARKIAATLDGWNRERRALERVTVEEAEVQIAALPDRERRRTLVLRSEGWHPGVVGIVASRLVERHHRPVVLLAEEAGWCRGSARGIAGVNLVEALRACADLLERFGGHRMAAGLTLRSDRVEALASRFEEVVRAATRDEDFEPRIAIDGELSAGAAVEMLPELDRLEPHGSGNPRPCFLARGLDVRDCRRAGERHLRLRLRCPDTGRFLDGIGFGMAAREAELGPRIDVVFAIEVDRWGGQERLRLRLRDFRKSQ